jgi:hypothetical protein
MFKIINIIIAISCLLPLLVIGQTNRGTVTYKVLLIDTVSNTITQNDSLYFRFIYKPNKCLQEQGFANHQQYLKTIINEKNVYSIVNEHDIKEAYHMLLPNNNIFNKLLNYKDTSLAITKTTLTKTIAGRVCKKMSLHFNDPQTPRVTLWYDSSIDCNSLIPGVGVNGKSIKGLVLEYEIQQPKGKCIITANTLSFASVSDALFVPNLTGFVVTEIPVNSNDDEDNEAEGNNH